MAKAIHCIPIPFHWRALMGNSTSPALFRLHHIFFSLDTSNADSNRMQLQHQFLSTSIRSCRPHWRGVTLYMQLQDTREQNRCPSSRSD